MMVIIAVLALLVVLLAAAVFIVREWGKEIAGEISQWSGYLRSFYPRYLVQMIWWLSLFRHWGYARGMAKRGQWGQFDGGKERPERPIQYALRCANYDGIDPQIHPGTQVGCSNV